MSNYLLAPVPTILAAIVFLLLTGSVTPSSAQRPFWFSDWSRSEPSWRRYDYGPEMQAYAVRFPQDVEPGQIIISFADRKLFHVHQRGRAVAYPIAVPERDAAWRGTLKITSKRKNPSWTPTAKMRRENPYLPAFVPGGHPRNPLGTHALYLGSTLYRIHGTDAPWTIGRSVSMGCIRMFNHHVAKLYGRVDVGTPVTVTYRSYLGRRR